MLIKPGYTFDDILLVPKKSTVAHRKDVDLFVDWGRNIKTLPIVSANMKHVTGPAMASALAQNKCMAILHRFATNQDRIDTFQNLIHYSNFIGMSFGVSQDEIDLFEMCYNKFCSSLQIACIDVAHGHSSACINAVSKFRSIHPKCLLIAGNVATSDGAYDLYQAGADVVKCGIGGGSICSTRVETGNGVPQVTALDDIWEYFKVFPNRPKLIADGGLSKVGNIVKALCFADGVMLGNMLAGSTEAPGESIIQNGKIYKSYAGSSTFRPNNIEGYVGLVPYKGPVDLVLKKITEGIQSGCSYQGVDNIGDLKNNPEFVQITHAGAIESGAHDLIF